MFTDELLEDLLINKKMMYSDAMQRVCDEKLVRSQSDFTDVKRIENAYQLVVKRHPKLSPSAFRRFVWMKSPRLASYLGWDKEFENKK